MPRIILIGKELSNPNDVSKMNLKNKMPSNVILSTIVDNFVNNWNHFTHN